MTAIELTDVQLRYPNGHEVLHNVNLRVNEGEIVGMLGASGAGKSTVLRLIAGLQPSQAGTRLRRMRGTSAAKDS